MGFVNILGYLPIPVHADCYNRIPWPEQAYEKHKRISKSSEDWYVQDENVANSAAELKS
jgi:hypothetical protein